MKRLKKLVEVATRGRLRDEVTALESLQIRLIKKGVAEKGIYCEDSIEHRSPGLDNPPKR